MQRVYSLVVHPLLKIILDPPSPPPPLYSYVNDESSMPDGIAHKQETSEKQNLPSGSFTVELGCSSVQLVPGVLPEKLGGVNVRPASQTPSIYDQES